MTNQQRHETRDVDQEVSLSPLDFGHVGHVLRRTRATDRARLELAGDSSAQGESNTGGLVLFNVTPTWTEGHLRDFIRSPPPPSFLVVQVSVMNQTAGATNAYRRCSKGGKVGEPSPRNSVE